MARLTRARFAVETLRPKGKYDKRSFRTKIARAHRITLGCPKGHWDPAKRDPVTRKKGTCLVPMEAQRILHPKEEVMLKNPCPYKIPTKKGRRLKDNPRALAIEKAAVSLYSKGYGRDTVARWLKKKYKLTSEWAKYFARRAAAVARGARKFVAPSVKKAVYPVLRNPRVKWYVGVAKDTGASYRFRSSVKPTRRSHGHLYKLVTGPFKSETEALNFERRMRT